MKWTGAVSKCANWAGLAIRHQFVLACFPANSAPVSDKMFALQYACRDPREHRAAATASVTIAVLV